ncbi:CPBP family intramembrane glutamic endopeptidase [Peribacillus loiseleuriae]|uniref:CPBP family intramembrane glutamic endopeptidase n=1 Tax=Peribacillus loiseleuriae TaxID=1679170 RepID=UPI003D007A3B
MKKEFWFVIITYVIMQLSGGLAVDIIAKIAVSAGAELTNELKTSIGAYWIVFSFIIALIFVLFFMRNEMRMKDMRNQTTIPVSILWGVGGIFLAMFAQTIAGLLEHLIGIKQNSQNTEQILKLITQFPIVMLVTSIVGPILEEIIFRKIIFGSLYKRLNFYLSALISSVIFGIAHFEPEHILLYSAMGFTFAYLYIKTNRILVPIFAHVTMNTLVVIVQMNSEKYLDSLDKAQSFIGGFL